MKKEKKNNRYYITLGFNPEPCLKNVPVMNQNELETENWFVTNLDSLAQG